MEVEDWGAAQGEKKRSRRDQSQERREVGVEAGAMVKIPYPVSVERPQTKKEALQMIEMGRRLLDLVLVSDVINFDQKQKENLSGVIEKLVGLRP